MMKLEITSDKNIYSFKFIKPDNTARTIQFTEDSYETIKNYFNPEVVKVKRSQKQPAKAPIIEDVRDYFKLKGYSLEAANKFHDYYSTTEWRGANGSPILNWKGKALAVWFVEKNKITEVRKSGFFK